MKKEDFNKRVWCYFNSYSGTLVGIFMSHDAAFQRAKKDGNRLPNGAKVFSSIKDASDYLGQEIKYGVQSKLCSTKEEPMIVCSVFEYDEFSKENK